LNSKDEDMEDLEKQMDMLETPKSEILKVSELEKNKTQYQKQSQKVETMKKLLSMDTNVNSKKNM
jgi:hypothetical protein